MDAEGFGRKLLLTPPTTPGKPSEKQTVGIVAASHEMLTFGLSHFRHCKERLPGSRKGLWLTFGSLSPKRPRPLTHCSSNLDRRF